MDFTCGNCLMPLTMSDEVIERIIKTHPNGTDKANCDYFCSAECFMEHEREKSMLGQKRPTMKES